MALAAPYTGEGELDALMDLIEPIAGIDDAEEAVLLGLFAALVRGINEAQLSAVARNRIAENIGPHTAMAFMNLTTVSHLVEREFDEISGISATELAAPEADQDWSLLGPVH